VCAAQERSAGYPVGLEALQSGAVARVERRRLAGREAPSPALDVALLGAHLTVVEAPDPLPGPHADEARDRAQCPPTAALDQLVEAELEQPSLGDRPRA